MYPGIRAFTAPKCSLERYGRDAGQADPCLFRDGSVKSMESGKRRSPGAGKRDPADPVKADETLPLPSTHIPFTHSSVVITRANRICCVTRIARWSSSAVTGPSSIRDRERARGIGQEVDRIAPVHGLACGRVASDIWVM